MKRNLLTLSIGLLLILLFAVLLFVFQVRSTEVALVTTFGKPTRPVTEPGAHMKLPWPIQKVYWFDKRVQNFEDDKFSEDLTADGTALLSMVYVGWRISDPQAFYPRFEGGSVQKAEKKLADLVRSAKNGVVGLHPLSDFVSPGTDGSRFVAIENEMLADVQNRVRTNNYGIEIEFLGIKKLGLPESVTQAVFDRMTSERWVRISKAETEGQGLASTIRSDAERQAAEKIALAEAEARRIRSLGEVEAAKSLAVLRQKPELANYLFSMERLEALLKDSSTTLIFDQDIAPFNLLRGATGTNAPSR